MPVVTSDRKILRLCRGGPRQSRSLLMGSPGPARP